MRPRIVTDEQRAELARVAVERRRLPSDKELARRCGVSTRAIQHIMRELLRTCEVSVGTLAGHDAHR